LQSLQTSEENNQEITVKKQEAEANR
jgi:hypothetical protein